MHWIISYDISDHRQRRKIARLLENLGARVQYSVFELQLNPLEQQTLEKALENLITPEYDSIRWYPQCHHCLGGGSNLGRERYLDQKGDYLLF